MSAYCYILYSSKLDKYYIGSTTDIHRRLEEHNRRKEKFTAIGIPWILVYKEFFVNLQAARGREHYIKKMKSRKFIESLIHSAE
jgi:putative endonuclease